MIKVGIVGGTGYTGVELSRLLAQHPEVALTAIVAAMRWYFRCRHVPRACAGRVDLRFEDPATANLKACDVVFLRRQTVSRCSRRRPCSTMVYVSSISLRTSHSRCC